MKFKSVYTGNIKIKKIFKGQELIVNYKDFKLWWETVKGFNKFEFNYDTIDTDNKVKVALEGNTLQNLFKENKTLIPSETVLETTTVANNVGLKTMSIDLFDVSLLKPNTKYTIVVFANVIDNTLKELYLQLNLTNTDNSEYSLFRINDYDFNKPVLVSTSHGIKKKSLFFGGRAKNETGGSAKISDLKILILEGDYANFPVEDYVEGIQSVGQKTKNLFVEYDELIPVKQGTTLYLSSKEVEGGQRIKINAFSDKGNTLDANIISPNSFYVDADGVWMLTKDMDKLGSKIVVNKDGFITFRNNVNKANTLFYKKFEDIQLEEGTVATSYEPYGYKIEAESRSKNLIKHINNYSNISSNGLVIQTIGDKILVNGTTTNALDIFFQDRMFAVPCKKGVEYTASIITHSGTVSGTIHPNLRFEDKDGNVTRYVAGTVTPLENEIFINHLRITPNAGFTFNNFLFSMQLEEGTTATSYVPYGTDKTVTYLNEQLHRLPNGIADEVTSDGQIIRRIKRSVLNSSEPNWHYVNTYGNVIRFALTDRSVKPFGDIVCDKFIKGRIGTVDLECTNIHGSQSELQFQIKSSRLETQDLNGFKQWLSENPVTVFYELAEPIVEEITPIQLACYQDKNFVKLETGAVVPTTTLSVPNKG
ncbi:MAG: hypothetical protein HUJ88_11480 [Fusobacterium necrophorum]|nr:hypothetical protein [Fusobacterium necrophorum]